MDLNNMDLDYYRLDFTIRIFCPYLLIGRKKGSMDYIYVNLLGLSLGLSSKLIMIKKLNIIYRKKKFLNTLS